MIRITRYFAQYGPRAMAGDPTAITIVAVAGICAAGAYLYKRICED